MPITHEVHNIIQLSDRQYVMYDAKIISYGCLSKQIQLIKKSETLSLSINRIEWLIAAE